jgi:Mn2+/Fe2+ NRAMP family transporter
VTPVPCRVRRRRIKLKGWQRALLTRCSAILPSLLVAIIGGDRGADSLIVLSQVILSICLPFALIPLVKFTSSPRVMRDFANSGWVVIVTLILSIILIAANLSGVFLVSTGASFWWQLLLVDAALALTRRCRPCLSVLMHVSFGADVHAFAPTFVCVC